MKQFMPFILLLVLSLPLPISVMATSFDPKDDLSKHPVYSTYDFGSAADVINFGTQPLFVPAGVIGEVMGRDRILRSSLKNIGLEIRFHPFLKGDDINFFLKQGKIDATMAGDMPTITTASSYDVVVTALAQQGFSSIVANDALALEGLKGKRIGYPPVSNAHFALLVALSAAGLKESDVTMSPMEIIEMVDALATKKIDAFVAWEPISTVALNKIDNAATVYRHLNSSYFYFSRSFVNHHPEAAPLILASMVRAFGWMKRDERNLLLASEWTLAAAKKLLKKPLELTAEQVAALTMRDILRITSHPTIPERDYSSRGPIRKKLDFLKAQGKLSSTFSPERVVRSFDRAMITSVLKNPKKFRLNSFDYEM